MFLNSIDTLVMHYFLILLISSTLFSCSFNQSKSTDNNPIVWNDTVINKEQLLQFSLDNSEDYRKVLEMLDKGDLASLDAAKILLINSVADTLIRDSMFVDFIDFYHSVAGGYLENNENIMGKLENTPSKEAIDQLKSNLAPYGFLLSQSKGTFYLEPQTEYLLQNFGAVLSPAYRDYLTIGSKEQKSGFAEDRDYRIPSDSLIARIITWENFMTRYPNFISILMAEDQYARYMGALLAGTNETKVFNSETNLLSDSSKLAFESLILKNPESKSSEVVKAYLELLKTTNFNYTDKVDSFLIEKVYH